MRFFNLLMLIALAQACSNATSEIPSYLQGIWASQDAVIQNDFPYEGVVIYLLADGNGAVSSGPPAIGAALSAVYISDESVLVCEIKGEDGETMDTFRLAYDPKSETLRVNEEVSLQRHSPTISARAREIMEID